MDDSCTLQPECLASSSGESQVKQTNRPKSGCKPNEDGSTKKNNRLRQSYSIPENRPNYLIQKCVLIVKIAYKLSTYT